MPDRPAKAEPVTQDPLQRRSPALFWIFSLYLRWYYFRRYFRAVRLSKAGLPHAVAGRPLIVYSNHPSWWDPALYILLAASLFPGRPGFGPMEAKALGRYGLLERMGVFGIELDTPRGSARFLQVSRRVLANPASVLWITAEGQFTDARQRPVRLRPGLAHMARRMPQAVILPLAIEYGFWNESRPEALVRFGAPIDCETASARSVTGWMAYLETALTECMDALAAESITRDPALFQPLVRGRAGIGGVYDGWRRLNAWAAGHGFDPSHEGPE